MCPMSCVIAYTCRYLKIYCFYVVQALFYKSKSLIPNFLLQSFQKEFPEWKGKMGKCRFDFLFQLNPLNKSHSFVISALMGPNLIFNGQLAN